MSVDFSNYDTGSLNQYKTYEELGSRINIQKPGASSTAGSMLNFRDAHIHDVIIANSSKQGTWNRNYRWTIQV